MLSLIHIWKFCVCALQKKDPALPGPSSALCCLPGFVLHVEQLHVVDQLILIAVAQGLNSLHNAHVLGQALLLQSGNSGQAQVGEDVDLGDRCV